MKERQLIELARQKMSNTTVFVDHRTVCYNFNPPRWEQTWTMIFIQGSNNNATIYVKDSLSKLFHLLKTSGSQLLKQGETVIYDPQVHVPEEPNLRPELYEPMSLVKLTGLIVNGKQEVTHTIL